MPEIQIDTLRKKSKFSFYLLFVFLTLFLGAILISLFTIHYNKEPFIQKDKKAQATQNTMQSPYGFTNRIDSPVKLNTSLTTSQISLYNSLNIHWVRLIISWAGVVETKQTTPPTYNWSVVDEQVKLANDNNIHVDFVITDSPSWNKSQICKADGKHFLIGQNEIKQFASVLASRYNGINKNGIIDSFEIGDEEFDMYQSSVNKNSSSLCQTPDYYVSVLKAGHDAIKAQSSRAMIGMFALRSDDPSFTSAYLNAMFRIDQNIDKYFDYANFHYYDDTLFANKLNNNHNSFSAEWQLMNGIFASHGLVKEIWCTATGGSGTNIKKQTESFQVIYDKSRLSDVVKKVFWSDISISSISEDKLKNNTSSIEIIPITDKFAIFRVLKVYAAKYPQWNQIRQTALPLLSEIKQNNVQPILTPTSSKPHYQFSHIFELIMENHDNSSIVKNTLQAPYINSLIQKYAFASNYTAVGSPSLPNYIGLTSGSTFGKISDCINCFINTQNIADEIESKGLTWKAYQESMPSACFLGNGPFVKGDILYAQKHNPFIYYDDIRTNPFRCQNDIVPFTQLLTDIQANTVPSFSFITPNMQNDMHDGTILAGDTWLANNIPLILNSQAYKDNGLLIITWDSGDGQSITTDPIPTLLISPLAKTNFQSSVPANHYSLLRTIEDNWGLPLLGSSAKTNAMKEYFTAK